MFKFRFKFSGELSLQRALVDLAVLHDEGDRLVASLLAWWSGKELIVGSHSRQLSVVSLL